MRVHVIVSSARRGCQLIVCCRTVLRFWWAIIIVYCGLVMLSAGIVARREAAKKNEHIIIRTNAESHIHRQFHTVQQSLLCLSS